MKSALLGFLFVAMVNCAVIGCIIAVCVWIGFTAEQAIAIWFSLCGLAILCLLIEIKHIERQEKLKREREDGFV